LGTQLPEPPGTPRISRYTFETTRSGRELEVVEAWTVMGGAPVGTTIVTGPQADSERIVIIIGTKPLRVDFIFLHSLTQVGFI